MLSNLPHLVPSVIYAATCSFLWARRQRLIYSAMVLPGVFLHELFHLLASLICNGQPVSMSLIPKRDDDAWVLGSVGSQNIRWYNAWLIGLAPLLLVGAVPIYLYYAEWMGLKLFAPQDFVVAPVIGSILITFWPSRADWWVASRSLPAILVLIAGAVWVTNLGWI